VHLLHCWAIVPTPKNRTRCTSCTRYVGIDVQQSSYSCISSGRAPLHHQGRFFFFGLHDSALTSGFFFFFFFFFPPWQSFFLTLEAKGWDRFLMIGAARVKQRLRGYSKALLSSRTPNGTEDEIFFIVFVSLKYGSRAILPAAAIRAFVLVGGSLDGGASLLATVCTIHALPDCLCLPSQTCFVLVLPCMHHPIFQDQDHFCPK
jgi:hypothetical protein